MIKSIGWNLHASYCSDEYWDTLMIWWKLNPPSALLIIDSFGNKENGDLKIVHRALQAERELPHTKIILRRYLTGDNYWREDGDNPPLTPEDWVQNYIDIKNTRIYGSILNEPDYPGSLDWTLNTMKAARAAGIRASVGGYNTGSPRVEDLKYAHNILVEMGKASNDGWFLLDLHEYGPALWTYDFDRGAKAPEQWPDKVTSNLYHWGRYRWWLKYCDQNNIKRPKIVIGELAFGLRVPEYENSFTIYECANVWRGWGYYNWQEYAAAQMKALWNAVYSNDPEIVGICYYCLNDQTDNWREFNAYYAPQFFLSVSEGFEMSGLATPGLAPYAAGKYQASIADAEALRVRNNPGTVGTLVIGEIRTGDTVQILSGNYQEKNGYIWQQVTVNGKTGWTATSYPGLKLTLIQTDPKEVLLSKIIELQAGLAALRTMIENLT